VRSARDPAPNAKPAGFPVMAESCASPGSLAMAETRKALPSPLQKEAEPGNPEPAQAGFF